MRVVSDHNLHIFFKTCNINSYIIYLILVNLQAVAGGIKCCFKQFIFYRLLPDKENTAFRCCITIQ